MAISIPNAGDINDSCWKEKNDFELEVVIKKLKQNRRKVRMG
jgi:hypothetical protein